MSSKNMNNYYDNGYNNNNNNLNYGYNYSNNNYNNNNYNNNYYNNNYNQYNNNNLNNYNQSYGNVLHYYNNYPVYSTIPASGPYANNNNNENDYSKKSSSDFTGQKPKTILRGKKGTRGAIILTPDKKNMCMLRDPQYNPNIAGINNERPAYTFQPPK